MAECTENDLIRWSYNCYDISNTLEVLEVQTDILASEDIKLQELYRYQVDKLHPQLLYTMYRGVKVDKEQKEELYAFFSKMMVDVKKSIQEAIGLKWYIDEKGNIVYPFNINSPVQIKKVLGDLLGIEIKVFKGKETCNSAAMLEYIEDYPLYRPFLTLLLEHASLKVFTNNFLGMKLDSDDRARTQYRITGTDTGRLASTKNVWGGGANFQNLPEKGKIKLKYAIETLEEDEEDDNSLLSSLSYEGTISLPNIKKIFLPDEGKEIADADLSGADIQIVAADSDCKWLLDFFANPKGKVYKYIASEFFQREITDEEYKTYKGIFHGTNYLMGIKKLAIMAGISESLAKELQDFYFHLNPEVKKWQEDIQKEIATKGYLTTIFGRRRWFLNKNDPMLANKATAFKPSSTIADLVNHSWVDLVEKHKEIDVLMQTHDSLTVQYDIKEASWARKAIIQCMERPLIFPSTTIIIPADLKCSLVSYGDCKKPKEDVK